MMLLPAAALSDDCTERVRLWRQIGIALTEHTNAAEFMAEMANHALPFQLAKARVESTWVAVMAALHNYEEHLNQHNC